MQHLASRLVVAGLLCGGGVAHAQAKIVPSDGIKGAEKTDLEGWSPFLGFTGTLSLASNSNVVGQVDGFSTLFGLGLTGGADYLLKRHVFRSSLSINESFARTPVIDEFVKTNDVLKLDGLYNYFLTESLGVFGRVGIQTSLFRAEDVRGVATTWVEKNPNDPMMPTPLTTGLRQKLAGAFSPFTLTETAGGFFDPLRSDAISLSLRAGVGGRHTFADGVYVLDDDKASTEVELTRLSDVHQLGLEGFAGVTGKLKDGHANYKAGVSVLFPFVNNDSYDRSAGSLTRVAFEGQLTFNVYSWMGLVYSLNVTRDPQLFPKDNELLQVQNTLLLTFQFTAVKKPEKKPEPTPEQIELEAAKKRAEEAEQRAREAEQKLQQPPAPATEPAPTP